MLRGQSKVFAAIALIVSLALTQTPAIAAPAVKPGVACTKLKSTKTIANLKYTCIINTNKKTKKTNKYVWGTAIEIGPAKPLSLSNLDVKWIRLTAYKNFEAELAASSAFIPSITYVLGPSLSQAQSTQEKTALERTAAFWSSLYKPTSVAIAYFNAADVDVIDGLACTIAQYCMANGGKISDMIRRDASRPGGACNSAFATQYSPTQQLFAQCLGPGNENLKNRQTTPHEYTHFAQQSSFHMQAPIWFVEGSAAYFGGAIGAKVAGNGVANMDYMIYTDARSWTDQTLVPILGGTAAEAEASLRRSYNRESPDGISLARLSYYPGAQATEVMVALWGMQKLKHFMTQIEPLGFDSAFVAEFGVSVDEFYPAVAKYIAAMYAVGR